MKLKQTLAYPTDAPYCWGGGKKQVFHWGIQGSPSTDSKGQHVRIGSLSANHWFHVALGKTVKATLANAKRHLRAVTRVPSTFEYVEDY